MAAKRKISIRRILQAFVTLVVTAACVVAVLGASRIQQSKALAHVEINISNGEKYRFIDKNELWHELVVNKGIKEGKTRLVGLDIRSLERTAARNPWVAHAQIFIDNKRNMAINLTQRVPAARIVYTDGQSFYLDTSLNLLPLSDVFTHYTIIVTNVPVLPADSLNKNLRAQIVQLVRFIESDTFWNAQIAQIIVGADQRFELVPVLGRHTIMFGDTTMMKNKFDNLFTFYRNVLNRIGWEKYSLLDVRYRDQVVASPGLPWKPASRNAISNMDWLQNIIDEAPKEIAQAPTPAAIPAKVVQKIAVAKPMETPRGKADQPQKKNEPTAGANGKYIYKGKTE
jgi:cell division protein FtsQ